MRDHLFFVDLIKMYRPSSEPREPQAYLQGFVDLAHGRAINRPQPLHKAFAINRPDLTEVNRRRRDKTIAFCRRYRNRDGMRQDC